MFKYQYFVRYCLGLALLGLISAGSVSAVPVTTLPAQTYEMKLPDQQGRAVVKKRVVNESSKTGDTNEGQSILRTGRTPQTPEYLELQTWVERLLKQPDDLIILQKLSERPELLQAYVTEKLYNLKTSTEPRALIKLFALALGEKSLPAILTWTEQFKKNDYILQSIIEALYFMPDSDQIKALVNGLLENELQHRDVIRSALLYHAARPDASSTRWAIQYRSPGMDSNLRYVGLYLAAVLGDQSVLAWTMESLDKAPPQYQRYYLHLALSFLISETRYQRLIEGMSLAPSVAASIHRQLSFKKANQDQRTALLAPMLASNYFEEKQLVLKYLIETQNVKYLSSLLQGRLAAEVYRKAQYAGINLDIEKQYSGETGVDIVSENLTRNWEIILSVTVVMLLMVIAWFFVRRHQFRIKLV